MLAKDIEMFLEHCELKGLSPTIEEGAKTALESQYREICCGQDAPG